jgi:hypothetical protein
MSFLIIVGFFSTSAILVVLGNILEVLSYYGKYLMMFGFGALVFGIGRLPWQFRKVK